MTPGPIKSLRDRRRTPECQHPGRLPDEPEGYVAWSDWAEEMLETHVQEQCPHCLLWVIWTPKAAAREAP